MIKSNGGIIGPDNVTTGGAFGSASGVFKLGEVTNLIKDSKWPTAGPGGFQVANSCRFDDGSSTQMNKTISSTSTTWTFSCWVKQNPTNTNKYLVSWDMGSGESLGIGIEKTSSSTQLFIYTSSTGQTPKLYDGVLRDSSAWMNIVIKNSSGTITSYINGTQAKTSITGTALASGTLRIGCFTGSNFFYDGYMSEVVLIDGTAYSANSFGEFNSQTGIWVPKDVSGLTFGSDGFYLDFKDSSNLGNDANGGTDLTEANLTSLDQSTDTCTNNGCTIINASSASKAYTLSEGNLKVTGSANNWYGVPRGNIGVSSGKWYFEAKVTDGNISLILGYMSASNLADVGDRQVNGFEKVNGLQSSGYIKRQDSSEANIGYTWSDGEIAQIALDMDNKKLWIGKNNGYYNSGNPSTGSNETIGSSYFTAGEAYLPIITFNGTNDVSFNFGSPPYAISSGNADANGFGNFEYTVPTGYLSLNTINLAAVLA